MHTTRLYSAFLAAGLFCGSATAFAQDSTAAPRADVAEQPAPAATQTQPDPSAPSADELVAAYAKNTGGMAAWEGLKSMTATMNMAMGPMAFPAELTYVAPDKQHVRIDLQGQEIIQAYDGERGWAINPMSGSTDPVVMSDAEAKGFTEQTVEPAFLHYADKGYTAEVVGTREVEGVQTYDLQLTKNDTTVEHYFFDREAMVPILQTADAPAGTPMAGQKIETYLSDYRDVDGMMLAMTTEVKMGGQTATKLQMTDVKINPEVDESIFEMPAAGGSAEPMSPVAPSEATDPAMAPADSTRRGR